MDYKRRKFIVKTVVFTLSLIIAWYLIRNGLLDGLPASPILAGMFYASFLTSPISLAMLVVLAKTNNPVSLALLAGVGAALADLLIVKLFRQAVALKMRPEKTSFPHIILGAIIIASPLPDELGLMMLGVSKLKYYQIAILTYVLNTAGILLIIVPVSIFI